MEKLPFSPSNSGAIDVSKCGISAFDDIVSALIDTVRGRSQDETSGDQDSLRNLFQTSSRCLLIRERLRELQDAGMQLPNLLAELGSFSSTKRDVRLDPLSELIARLTLPSERFEPWSIGSFDIFGMTLSYSVSAEDVHKAATLLVRFGADVRPLPSAPISISKDISGKLMKRQGAWPRPRSMSALLTNLLLRAQSNETTWGHIAHLCRIWPDGAVGPNDLPDHVRSSLVAPEWVLLASKDLDGLAPAVGEISLAHAWRAAARLGKPIGRLREVMEPFHLLGGRFSDSSIVHFDLVQLAAIAGSSLGEVWDELSIWPSLSLDLPKLEANKRDSRPPRRIDEMLSPFMTDVGPHAWAELTPADVIEEAAQQQVSCGDILNKLAPLCDYGVILPTIRFSRSTPSGQHPFLAQLLANWASKQGHPGFQAIRNCGPVHRMAGR